LQRSKGHAFCLGNLLMPQQSGTAPSQEIQAFLISTSFRHLFDAAGGTFNPMILSAHLYDLDTRSSEYSETLQGYLNPDISYQHSILLPMSVCQKLLNKDPNNKDFIWCSEESVRLHKVAVPSSGQPLQAMFSLGKGLFAHQTRVITEISHSTLAMIERDDEVCSFSGCSLSASPQKIQPNLLIQKNTDKTDHPFKLVDHNRHWPWI